MTSDAGPWERIDPPELARPVGYSHAIRSTGGRRITLAGQVAMDREGQIRHPGDVVGQAALAFSNLAAVLRHAGAEPHHLVRVRIYLVDVDGYRRAAQRVGKAWRETFGRWYPAMTAVGVACLYDPGALIEVEGEAVVP